MYNYYMHAQELRRPETLEDWRVYDLQWPWQPMSYNYKHNHSCIYCYYYTGKKSPKALNFMHLRIYAGIRKCINIQWGGNRIHQWDSIGQRVLEASVAALIGLGPGPGQFNLACSLQIQFISEIDILIPVLYWAIPIYKDILFSDWVLGWGSILELAI